MENEGSMENYLKRNKPAEETKEEEKVLAPKRNRERSVAWDHFKKCSKNNHCICNYCARTIPRIAIDPSFKKDGFLGKTNADLAAQALEQELVTIMSKTPRQQPTSTIDQPSNQY
ncbi:hypothetical protein ACLKA7_001397 [Drosophila subpalustris]